MNILFINPIMYSCESKTHVHSVNSIKDTLIYNLCLEFYNQGHKVVLYTTDIYKPCAEEDYPFEIIWDTPIYKKVFLPAAIPYLKKLKEYLIANSNCFDFIITSEAFQLTSLFACLYSKCKVFIWHETARHNNYFYKLPSKIWYNTIFKLLMKKAIIIPRSSEAKEWIAKYTNKVLDPIEHGINGDIFQISNNERKCFVVCAQLIKRKQIDYIIKQFYDFIIKYPKFANIKLYICGSGDQIDFLKALVTNYRINDNVIFTGKLGHSDLIRYIGKAYAILIHSMKENSMVSIIESIGIGTPIVTNTVPLNSSYIKKYNLGIVNDNWGPDDLYNIVINNSLYVKKCIMYRPNVLNYSKVNEFINVYREIL